MTLNELFRLKEQLLANLKAEIRPGDFETQEEYLTHFQGAQEGIMIFFSKTMIQIIEAEGHSKAEKKSA